PEERLDTDIEHRAEPGRLHLLDRAVVQDHRVVDDRVDASVRACESGRDVEVRVAHADVTLVREGLAARPFDLACGRAGVAAVDVDDGDGRAEAREVPREVGTEPAAGAGDQDVLVVESVSHRAARYVVVLRPGRREPRAGGHGDYS